MTKLEAYRFLASHTNACSFLANVVANSARYPARRLKALVALVKAGADVRLASHSIDHLLVDGYHVTWTDLDAKPALAILEELESKLEACGE